jgi:hypothetical protein
MAPGVSTERIERTLKLCVDRYVSQNPGTPDHDRWKVLARRAPKLVHASPATRFATVAELLKPRVAY